MAAQPTVVYLLVNTPNHERTVGTATEPTTWSAYAYDIEGTIEDTVRTHSTQFPLGSVIKVTTDAKCKTYTLNASLDEGQPDDG